MSGSGRDLAGGLNGRPRAAGQSTQEVSGDQVLDRIPVEPVGSMHQMRPRSFRRVRVSRRRSLLTLAATTGPSQPRIAGTASAVVFPLWVGSDDHDRLGPFGDDEGRAESAGDGAQSQPARMRHPRVEDQVTEVIAAGPAGAAPVAAGAAAGRWSPGTRRRRRARRREPREQGVGNGPARAQPTAIAPSVFTSLRSMLAQPVLDQERPCPTFHRATPRRSCGNRAASVEERESRSDATANSPGDWA